MNQLRVVTKLTAVVAILTALLAPGYCSAATVVRKLFGEIVAVSDGDTVTLLDADRRQHKIRLDGIDAPEGRQPFGAASKRHLSDLAFRRTAIAECAKTDRYGRQVCKLLIDGADAGLEQVRAGMAWYFRRYAKELAPDRRQQYGDTEAQAKGKRRGLWVDAEAVAPWDWRRQKQLNGAAALARP